MYAFIRGGTTAASGQRRRAVLPLIAVRTPNAFASYDAAASPWLVALIRPAWHRSERYRPALLATPGEPQTEHRAVEQRLLEACVAHDPAAAATALHDHLELASPIFEHELGGRGIFERV